MESDRIAAEAKKSIDELHGYIAQRAEIAKAGFTDKIPVEQASDNGQEEDEQVLDEQFTGEQESEEQISDEPVKAPSEAEEEKEPE